MKARPLVLIGSILLLVGAATPWTMVNTPFTGIVGNGNGLVKEGILTAIGGAILLLIAVLTKAQSGKSFSMVGMRVPTACGFIIGLTMLGIIVEAPVDASMDYGLTCLSPLGVLFSFFGSTLPE